MDVLHSFIHTRTILTFKKPFTFKKKYCNKFIMCSFNRSKRLRYLESSSSQNSGSLIFCHVWCCYPLLVGLLALACRKDLNILLVFLSNKVKKRRFHIIAAQRPMKKLEDTNCDYSRLPGFPSHLILRPLQHHQNLRHQSYKNDRGQQSKQQNKDKWTLQTHYK